MNQMSLVTAITKEIEKQKVSIDVKTLNKVVDCANQIIAEIERPRVYADGKMSFMTWFASDDTGASSKWLASVLNGGTPKQVNYPYDPSDFGRCYRMLNCVEGARWLFEQKKSYVASLNPVWAKYIERWDELEALWKKEIPKKRLPMLYELMQELQKEAQPRQEAERE